MWLVDFTAMSKTGQSDKVKPNWSTTKDGKVILYPDKCPNPSCLYAVTYHTGCRYCCTRCEEHHKKGKRRQNTKHTDECWREMHWEKDEDGKAGVIPRRKFTEYAPRDERHQREMDKNLGETIAESREEMRRRLETGETTYLVHAPHQKFMGVNKTIEAKLAKFPTRECTTVADDRPPLERKKKEVKETMTEEGIKKKPQLPKAIPPVVENKDGSFCSLNGKTLRVGDYVVVAGTVSSYFAFVRNQRGYVTEENNQGRVSISLDEPIPEDNEIPSKFWNRKLFRFKSNILGHAEVPSHAASSSTTENSAEARPMAVKSPPTAANKPAQHWTDEQLREMKAIPPVDVVKYFSMTELSNLLQKHELTAHKNRMSMIEAYESFYRTTLRRIATAEEEKGNETRGENTETDESKTNKRGQGDESNDDEIKRKTRKTEREVRLMKCVERPYWVTVNDDGSAGKRYAGLPNEQHWKRDLQNLRARAKPLLQKDALEKVETAMSEDIDNLTQEELSTMCEAIGFRAETDWVQLKRNVFRYQLLLRFEWIEQERLTALAQKNEEFRLKKLKQKNLQKSTADENDDVTEPPQENDQKPGEDIVQEGPKIGDTVYFFDLKMTVLNGRVGTVTEPGPGKYVEGKIVVELPDEVFDKGRIRHWSRERKYAEENGKKCYQGKWGFYFYIKPRTKTERDYLRDIAKSQTRDRLQDMKDRKKAQEELPHGHEHDEYEST